MPVGPQQEEDEAVEQGGRAELPHRARQHGRGAQHGQLRPAGGGRRGDGCPVVQGKKGNPLLPAPRGSRGVKDPEWRHSHLQELRLQDSLEKLLLHGLGDGIGHELWGTEGLSIGG